MLTAAGEAGLERRRYRGMNDPAQTRCDVSCGEAKKLSLSAGSLISITNVDGGAPVWITARTDAAQNFSTNGLDLKDATTLPLEGSAFDARAEVGVATAHPECSSEDTPRQFLRHVPPKLRRDGRFAFRAEGRPAIGPGSAPARARDPAPWGWGSRPGSYANSG